KAARRIGVSKELLDQWMNTPEISKRIHHLVNHSRRMRANLLVHWAKVLSKTGPCVWRFPATASDGELDPDAIDYGNTLPLAKEVALVFEYPETFRASLELVLTFHEFGGLSSAKQFFIDLGKCLSFGIPGARGINRQLWDKLDLDIADIILS